MNKGSLYISFLFVFQLFISIPSYSNDRMRIVIMNLKADGVSERMARTASNMLRSEFINIGTFTIVERAQMDMILKEQGLQQTGCTDQECAVQMGRLMSARKILVGEVSPMGKSIIMTVRIVDVEKGVSEFAATQKATSEDVLDQSVSRIAQKISLRINRKAKYTLTPMLEEQEEPEGPKEKGGITSSGYYLRGIIPGWGQFYAGRTVKGFVYGGLFVASGLFAAATIGNYQDKKKEYDDLRPIDTESDIQERDRFDTVYKEYDDAAKGAKFMTGLFWIVYLANWVDILFFSKPDFNRSMGMSENSNSSFHLNICNRSYLSQERNIELTYVMRF
ncbi:MAG: CsgG/HfaB family protein [Spirochaetota bacterium]|nr:CsgG/HfaB family protein [Spirochaetota bacterium]